MSLPSKKTFKPHFSDTVWLRFRVQELEDALTKEMKAHKETRHQLEHAHSEKQRLLNNLLTVEHAARVEKGCYTHCPVGRLTGGKYS